MTAVLAILGVLAEPLAKLIESALKDDDYDAEEEAQALMALQTAIARARVQRRLSEPRS